MVETQAVLRTKRLVLRAFHPNDVDAVFAYNSTAQWSPYLRSDSEGYTRKDAEDFVARAILQESKNFAQFAITMGRKVIGGIGLKIEPQHGTGELKFSIGARHRSQGVVTEAAAALIEYGFKGLGLSKIHARADGKNEGVVQMFGKVGMVQEALLKGQRLHGDERVDEVIFGLLRGDWLEQAEATTERLNMNG